MALKGFQYKNYSLHAKQNKVAPQYRDLPNKKYSGKGVNMLNWLQEILGDAYSDDIEKKISHGKSEKVLFPERILMLRMRVRKVWKSNSENVTSS